MRNMKKKHGFETVLYTALITLMLLALPLAVPSGAVLLSADQAYGETGDLYTENWEDEDGQEEIPAEEPEQEAGKQLVLSAGGSLAPEGAIPTLPIDFSEGLLPNPAGFTQDGYEDESISVVMEHREVNGSMAHVARIKIADASQLRTALAGPFGSKRTNKTSSLAKKNNAVVAINGDYYTNDDKGSYVYVVRQGEVHRTPSKDKGSLHVLVIDRKGDFHILVEDKMKQFAALMEDKENPILQAFTFGPALVIDGAVQAMPESYQFNIRRAEPRAAIGQVGPLEYVLVVVDGRMDHSPGFTMVELAGFMGTLGCTQAYNLDGGNSSAMIFNNAFYSHDKTNSERSTSDIIYFASAIDPASWQ